MYRRQYRRPDFPVFGQLAYDPAVDGGGVARRLFGADLHRLLQGWSPTRTQFYLTECIHQFVLESQLPQKLSTYCLLLLIEILS